jgi:hypothetical protein
LRIRFLGWRRAEPFLTLGISAFLKKFSFFQAHWRQLICREPILQYITELATQAEKQACLIDYPFILLITFYTFPLASWILIAAAALPVIIAELLIRLRRLAFLPLIR